MPNIARCNKKWLVWIFAISFFYGCAMQGARSSQPEIHAFQNHLKTLKGSSTKVSTVEYSVGNLSCEKEEITVQVAMEDYHYVRLYAPCFTSGPLTFTERGRKECIELLAKARSLYFKVYMANITVPTLIGTTTEGLEVRLRIMRGTTSGTIALRRFGKNESCSIRVYPHISETCSAYRLIRLLEAAPKVAAKHFATEDSAK